MLGVVVVKLDDNTEHRAFQARSVFQTYLYWPNAYENGSAAVVLASVASAAPQTFDIG